MPLIMGGSIVSGALGGLLGGNAAKKAAQSQADMIAAAMAQAQKIIDDVGAPPDLSKAIMLEQLQLAGVLTPELEEAINIGPSAVAAIQEDPGLRKAQVQALHEMSKRGRAGLTAEERAEMNRSRQDVQRDLSAKEDQIINEMAMRGQAGGGAEIAQRLLASQAGADRASEEADRIQALAAQRALQAIQAESAMAGQLRNQDFDIAATKAGAEDEFERFNVQNQIDRQQRNVATKNIAQERNLGEKQRIQDTNTGMANNEKYRQAQAQRDFWGDKMRQAEAKVAVLTGGMGQQAAATKAAGDAQANMWGQIGGGLSSGFGALSNYYASQPKTKTEVVGENGGTADALKRKGVF